MSRELWLLRHAKSDRNVCISDIDRPLKKKGKRAAERIGSWMKQQNLIPDRVVSSPAQRAIATAKIVCKAIGLSRHSIRQDTRVYGQGLGSLKSVLAQCPVQSERVLIVGHNPELEELLVNMAGENNVPDADKLLPTAALARLAMPDDWANLEAGGARLLAIIYAKSLPAEGK
ncbi:Phosphohistidine phosphatase [Candidatus Methylobacter favarea]|uniref:Phosphohistidine phosphatase n=1 Tax=Candidatus Methylobacter favarea TaxID=2707345 RepID=A0A8S0WPZ0_9GAMM|nr:histidine phosphatase family protein [Candidatus Methylobacter favarea]CAA9891145.1 Phosphohistidine phosphatase [Candidatus Methylobacter favarea]